MAASAGTLTVQGKSGRTFSIDLYLPDAVGGLVTFNPTGAAASTSPNTYRPTEDVVVTDLSVVTGTTAVGAQFLVDGAAFSGNTVRYANQLNTLANRNRPAWAFRAGTLVGAIQI